jgi:GT2 family glycosyltransferase
VRSARPVDVPAGGSTRDTRVASEHDLAARLRARLSDAAEPSVSVVMPVFNNWPVTLRALESLAGCDPDVTLQLVVVDDASTDETAAALRALPGIDVVRQDVNRGFVHACNAGAAASRGSYLLFLNNDTEVSDDGLRALVRRAESDAQIGIVGSKLVYPDGRLQEAGGIVWADGGAWNYGRFDIARRPEYNFVRDVDYVSGASLLIRNSLFRAIGGFDERFAPAYYEDVDLCFEARSRGYRVVYEPRSAVTHYEGISSGADPLSGTKRFQGINAPKFRAKWSEVLKQDHLAPGPDGPDRRTVRIAARRRGRPNRTILIVDSYVPLHDREAGSNRLQHLIDGFIEAGNRVIFLPDNLAPLEPYTTELQALGVEVLYYTDGDVRRCQEWVLEALATADVAWLCRPELCRKYLPSIRSNGSIPIVYDTIDLHFLRLRRQAEIEGNASSESWRHVEELELICARAADGTIVVTAEEAAVLHAAAIEPIAIVPTIHDLEPIEPRSFSERSGLLFIGGYNHAPNVDAVEWLVREIMPAVWSVLPDVRVTLLGANPTPAVLALANERVIVPGYVRFVEPYFQEARIFIAPLRYGAGMKGKVGHALAHRLPVVTTSVGAEGFALTDKVHAVVANDATRFAEAVVDLYRDPVTWVRLSRRAAEALHPFNREVVVPAALDFIDRVSAECAPSLSVKV